LRLPKLKRQQEENVLTFVYPIASLRAHKSAFYLKDKHMRQQTLASISSCAKSKPIFFLITFLIKIIAATSFAKFVEAKTF